MDNTKKREKVTFLELLKIIVKKIRISTLIMLIITFASTSFAWFVYATQVRTGIQAHIETWNILFTADDNAISEEVTFVIPQLYPGMPDFEESIVAYNLGEKSATVTYEIQSVKILGVTTTPDSMTTSQMIENRLLNDYPFRIVMSLTNDEVSSSTGTTTFTVTAEWDYESGHDAVDTDWGKRAYNYHSSNPTLPSIEMTVLISATQDNS